MSSPIDIETQRDQIDRALYEVDCTQTWPKDCDPYGFLVAFRRALDELECARGDCEHLEMELAATRSELDRLQALFYGRDEAVEPHDPKPYAPHPLYPERW